MLSLSINNPIIENFYQFECDNDNNKFLDNLIHYIEIYNIKQSVKKGFEEIKLQNIGQLEKKELKHILDEL